MPHKTSSAAIAPSTVLSTTPFVDCLNSWFYSSKEEILNVVDKDEMGQDDQRLFDVIYTEPVESRPKPKRGRRKAYKTDKDLRENVPSSLSIYHKNISKHDPMTRDEELGKFTKYQGVKKKLRAAINKLPHDRKVILTVLFKDLNKNYTTFKSEISNLPDASREDMQELLERRDAIRNEIIRRNLRFVIKIAKTFWKDCNIETFNTLISAGNMGLFSAIDKFDPKRGTRFLSYAAHWIALEMRLEISNDSVVQVPLWWQKIIRRMSKVYEASAEPGMTAQELAVQARVSLKHINLVNNNHTIVNRNNLVLSQVHYEFTDKQELMHDKGETHDDELARLQIRKYLQDFINALPTKEQGVVRLLFGLSYENRDLNLRQIGNIYNLTSERVRQIKEKALDTLRNNFNKIGYHKLNDIL